MAAKPGPGPRGLAPDDMVAAALEVMENKGADRFSVRQVAIKAGCDPMSVLYHFKSKEGLERAMADAINAQLHPLNRSHSWRQRLEQFAAQYRHLALRYPHSFPLLLRFWVTGPNDYFHAESIYQALEDAGLNDRDIVDTLFGWYASILGLASAEAGGLLQPADADTMAELHTLDQQNFPTTRRLEQELSRQEPGRTYQTMVQTILDGIALRANS